MTAAWALEGQPLDLSGAGFDPSTHSLTIPLPDGLAVGESLTLSYSYAGRGVLTDKKVLLDATRTSVTARGALSDSRASASAELTIPLVLESRILIRPADMVIYASGRDTDSEVVEDAQGDPAEATNLPEPGFFIILSWEAERQLRQAVDPAGTLQGQLDLSDYLTFTDGDGNVWGLELFNQEYSKAWGSYLYRLIPIWPEVQDPIRLQFYDGQRYIIESDFDITQALNREYEMSLYPGEVDQSAVQAVLTANGRQVGAYGLGVSPGTLTVRGTTDAQTTAPIQADPMEQLEAGRIAARALEPAATRFYINLSQLTVAPEDVALLVDNIVDDAHSQTLKDLAAPVLDGLTGERPLRFQFQYLDLVDTDLSNAWVTASQPMEIYWPYPEGTGMEDDFTLIHYKGMDRDYDLADMAGLALGTDYTLEVYTTGQLGEDSDCITYHRLTAGEEGLSFTADGFSPYVLVWEGTESSGSAQGPAGLNTQDHIAYLIGRGGGGVQPTETITRAEVAAILFRLLTDEARAEFWSTADCYPDVAADAWYHNPVSTLTAMGILTGRPDGTFGPDQAITRAELVAMVLRFYQTSGVQAAIPFPDVSGDAWYADAVSAGVSLGLLVGRGDGTFAPTSPITRAETATFLNRALGRRPQDGQLLDGAVHWADNPADAWYYEDMLEATVTHTFLWTGTGAEQWTALPGERDWTALERWGPESLKES